MNESSVELIVFDLGRVLVDFDFRLVINRLRPYTHLTGRQIHHFFLHTPLWDAFERGLVSPETFFEVLRKELRLTRLGFDAFIPIWSHIFTEKHDTVAVLNRLRGRYRMAMLSNVNVMHWEYVKERHAFMEWFDHPIASYAVGLRKPESAIYRHTLERAGVSPQRAVFVDDVESHVHAARALGMRAHQFIDARQLQRDIEDLLE